jgi:hypothetical protein
MMRLVTLIRRGHRLTKAIRGQYPLGEKQSQPFHSLFNASLNVDFLRTESGPLEISFQPDVGAKPASRAIARSCIVARGSRQILALRDQILALRVQAGQQEDVTNDPDWFVSMTLARSFNPWVVLLNEQQRPAAAILFAERHILGFPSGYMKAEGMDEGFLICRPELRSTYLPLLLNGLFSRSSATIAHVAQLTQSDTAHSAPADSSALDVEWKQGLYHHRISLMETMEETLASYGPRTRRNLRYYLRRARANGCSFIAALTGEQRLRAVTSLRAHATHKVTAESARLREGAIQSVANSFAMGMQGPNGIWLSYLTGWRSGTRTFVYWQMNRTSSASSSIGTAIRSFLMEQEIARGATEIVFVGGSSEVFKRCCKVDQSVHLIVRRRGLRGWALSRILERTVVPGHPLKQQHEIPCRP